MICYVLLVSISISCTHDRQSPHLFIFPLLKHIDYIQLPCIEIFHLITRVHGSVPLKCIYAHK